MYASTALSPLYVRLAALMSAVALTACGGGGAATPDVQDAGQVADAAAHAASAPSARTPAPVASSPATKSPAPAPAPSPLPAPAPAPAPVQHAQRPVGNTGVGFFTIGRRLYDANGMEFRPRGVNRVHWDNGSVGLPKSGAAVERIAIDFNQSTTTNLNIIQNQMVAYQIVPMPGNWNGTCNSDPAVLSAIVDTWVAQAAAWKTLDRYSIINIANEWGPPNSTVWRDSYITAVARMRAAGYTGTLAIDAGGCGQDANDLLNYAKAVLASDPQKNLVFDLHIYGYYEDPKVKVWTFDLETTLNQLGSLGVPVMIGEFGPGRNIGPSATLVTPQRVISLAEKNGLGWLAWAWDDNNLPNCRADNNWFSLTLQCGTYNSNADLTLFGLGIVPALQRMAVKATSFN